MYASVFQFADVYGAGADIMLIKGGRQIQIQNDAANGNVDLMNLESDQVQVHVPFKCHSTVELENDSLGIAYTNGLQTALNSKANQSNTYTKNEVQNLILLLDVDRFWLPLMRKLLIIRIVVVVLMLTTLKE